MSLWGRTTSETQSECRTQAPSPRVCSSTTLTGVWDVDTGRLVGEPLRGDDTSLTMAVGPDGRLLLASGSQDNTTRVWEAGSGELVGEPVTGRVSCLAMAVSPCDGAVNDCKRRDLCRDDHPLPNLRGVLTAAFCLVRRGCPLPPFPVHHAAGRL